MDEGVVNKELKVEKLEILKIPILTIRYVLAAPLVLRYVQLLVYTWSLFLTQVLAVLQPVSESEAVHGDCCFILGDSITHFGISLGRCKRK